MRKINVMLPHMLNTFVEHMGWRTREASINGGKAANDDMWRRAV